MKSIERRVYLQREVHTDSQGRKKVVARLVVEPERPAIESRELEG